MDAERTHLDVAEHSARGREEALRAERADLAAQRDPKPADPPWPAPERVGEPLWRCVDFTGDLNGAGQAGLEGALLAAGLLSAVVQPDGSLRAADGEVLAARKVATGARARADASAARAAREAERARGLRSTWAAEMSTHQATCAHHSLPTGAEALEGTAVAARRAKEKSTQLGQEFGRLAERGQRHDEQLRRAEEASALRDSAEQAAVERWAEWHAAASELAAQHEAVDLPLEQARAELAHTKAARERADRDHRAAYKAATELGPRLGDARRLSLNAVEDVRDRTAEMVGAAHRFNRCIALPGLAAAATTEALAEIVHPEQAGEVRSAAEAVLSAVAAPRPSASLNTASNAFREFDREVSGQLDVRQTIDDGMLLVEIAGAGDEHTLAGAARALGARVEAGRAALSERERAVFTRFVLGGVAEELRRRVNQADQLIGAMNTSLRGIRTSNGIGVRLGWKLREDYELRRGTRDWAQRWRRLMWRYMRRQSSACCSLTCGRGNGSLDTQPCAQK